MNKEINFDEHLKKHAVDFCAWFMQLLPEDLTYYIVEPGSGDMIPQYYTREEMYDKYIKIFPIFIPHN